MTDLTTLLHDGDPVREDAGLSPVDAERMRRVVVSAAIASVPMRAPWLRPFAIAAIGALLVVVGTMTGHRVIVERAPAPMTTTPVALPDESAADGERRQLQFSTPGGTRIIWIFDEGLRLQESMP
jgi:hypothetical protein